MGKEISRGFFLPLLCVAISASSRIRIILLRMGREAVQECMEVLQSVDTIFPDITEKENVKNLCKFPDKYIGKFMETPMQVFNEDSSVPIEMDIGESVENLNFHTDKYIYKLSNTKKSNTLVTPSKLPKTNSCVEVSK